MRAAHRAEALKGWTRVKLSVDAAASGASVRVGFELPPAVFRPRRIPRAPPERLTLGFDCNTEHGKPSAQLTLDLGLHRSYGQIWSARARALPPDPPPKPPPTPDEDEEGGEVDLEEFQMQNRLNML
eukprot:2035807-Prymnesium_polylepis.1